MGIETNHPDYARLARRMQRMRDVMGGQEAIHAAGERYLPRLTDQTNEEYAAYLTRTPFFNATARTISALHGLIFAKRPTVAGGPSPESIRFFVDDANLEGDSLEDVARAFVREVMTTDRAGLLVDYPRMVEGLSNAAQAAALRMRPFVRMYTAEQIVNWRHAYINNRRQLTLVVLAETHTEVSEDGFSETVVNQRRALKIDAEGFYVHEIWRETAGEGWALVDAVYPLANGLRLREIPFVLEGDGQPPLADLADLNLSHFRTAADLEHGAHFTGLPTPVISGYHKTDPDEKFFIGSTSAWIFSDANAKASYLEFSGQGLGALEKLIASKEAQMAQLGARMLVPSKGGVEAARTLEIRTEGETSMLADISRRCSNALSRAFRIALAWGSISEAEKATLTLNTDFVTGRLEPSMLTALVSAWQSGAISSHTLFYNLKQGEAMADDVDFETEQERIRESAPAMTPPAAVVDGLGTPA